MSGYTRVRGPDGQIKADVVSRDIDGVYVAASRDCPPWMADDAAVYQAWLAAGNVPVDPPAPSAPTVITRLQGRLALSRAALLDKAESAVAAAGGETAIWYADAQTWRRDDPHVAAIGDALQLTGAQVDALFEDASKIV